MEEYATNDKLSEYLVDGTILRCTGATTDDVCGITLNIYYGADSKTARLRTTLNLVLKNVTPIMSIGMAAEKLQGLLKDNNYNYDAALRKYNQGNPAYVKEVNDRVEKGNNFVGD